MKRNIKERLLTLALSLAMALGLVISTPMVAAAEEEHSADIKFTINAIKMTDPTANSTLQEACDTIIHITEDPLYVNELAPQITGYTMARCDYKYGVSNYVGAKYFMITPVVNNKTGVTVYNPYIYYGGASMTLNSSKSILTTKTNALYFRYELTEYAVVYNAEGVENVPVDDATYNYENTTEIVVADAVPTKDGYNFTGWLLEEEGKLYQPGEVVDFKAFVENDDAKQLTFTAQYEEIPTANVDVTMDVVASWGDYVQTTVKVTNNSDEVMKSWKVAFDYEGAITQIWGAELVSADGYSYVVKHPSWALNLQPGETVEFGMIAQYEEVMPTIENSQLVSDVAEVDAESYEVTFVKDSEWDGGFNASIVITNKTDANLENWTIAFDYADEITSIWGGTIVSHEGTRYIIENAGYNADIQEQVSIGFAGVPSEGGTSTAVIENVTLTSVN